MPSMVVTLEVLKPLRLMEDKDMQRKNICFMVVTLEVFRPLRLMDFKDVQP